MKLTSSAGHSPNCEGATGNGYKENAEAQKLNAAFIKICEANGVSCTDCSSTASTQSAYLSEQVKKANASSADMAVQWHFNAYNGSATGTEVLYYPSSSKGKSVATDASTKIASLTGLLNRGAKSRSDLYWLNNTKMTAILIEVCFIDNASDMNKAVSKYEEIAAAVFEAMTGIEPKEEEDMALTSDDALTVWQYKNKNVNPDYNDVYHMMTTCTRAAEKMDALLARLDEIENKLSEIEVGTAACTKAELTDALEGARLTFKD